MCKLDKELLYSYTDKTIDPLEKIFVEEHIKYCTECQRDLKFIGLVDDVLEKDFPSVDLPVRLNLLSVMIAENCINQIEDASVKDRITAIIRSCKHFSDITMSGIKAYKSNPYNKYINDKFNYTLHLAGKGMSFAAGKLKKPLLSRFKYKMLSSNPLRIMK